MKWFLIIFSLSLFIACSPKNESSENPLPNTTEAKKAPEDTPSETIVDDDRNLIIGGDKIKKKDQLDNYTVSLINVQQGSLCTASILTEEFLLTAAHCLTGQAEDIKISFSLKTSEKKLRSIQSYKTHSYWNQSSQDKNAFDIGLVYFKGGLPKGYEKVSLLPSSYKFQDGQTVILAGFGITNGERSTGAGVLRSTEALIKNAHFSETEILIDQTNHKGACHGDSGGPAFVKLSDGKYLYWGITSRGYGPKGENCESYSIYTKIMPFRSWVNWAVKELRKDR